MGICKNFSSTVFNCSKKWVILSWKMIFSILNYFMLKKTIENTQFLTLSIHTFVITNPEKSLQQWKFCTLKFLFEVRTWKNEKHMTKYINWYGTPVSIFFPGGLQSDTLMIDSSISTINWLLCSLARFMNVFSRLSVAFTLDWSSNVCNLKFSLNAEILNPAVVFSSKTKLEYSKQLLFVLNNRST